MATISFTDVSVEAQGRTLLAPTTLTITEQRVAVVGANGSGKSTFLRLVNGLVGPTYGAVTVDGDDTIDHASKVRAQVAFTFPDPHTQILAPTVGEDLELSLRIARRRKRHDDVSSQVPAHAQTLLDQWGLGLSPHQAVASLSSGQAQLVALMSVLATGPRVVVCDEPTTRLDARWRRRVINLLATVDQQVIFATHDLDHARSADRVIVIDHGHVIADGSPDEALAAYDLVLSQPWPDQ